MSHCRRNWPTSKHLTTSLKNARYLHVSAGLQELITKDGFRQTVVLKGTALKLGMNKIKARRQLIKIAKQKARRQLKQQRRIGLDK